MFVYETLLVTGGLGIVVMTLMGFAHVGGSHPAGHSAGMHHGHAPVAGHLSTGGHAGHAGDARRAAYRPAALDGRQKKGVRGFY